MNAGGLVVVAVAALLLLSACGSRTGLGFELLDSGVPSDGSGIDASVESGTDATAESGNDADAALLSCPLSPPDAGTSCEVRSMQIQCVYHATATTVGLTCFACDAGGWISCTTVAYTTFSSCSQVVCGGVSNEFTECIVADGEQCCTCSADGTDDQCGPC
jgi:hypothetical protein